MGQAVVAIRGVDRRGLIKIGLTIAMGGFYSVPGGETVLAEIQADAEDQVLGWGIDCDFIGVQVYFATPVGPDGPQHSTVGEKTQMGYPWSPEGVEYAVRYAALRSGLPIIVTENGLATEDDTRRVDFIQRTAQHIRNCVSAGIS